MPTPLISPFSAALLGIVEGLTEYLPVSSTGHLILAASALGLPIDDPGVRAFIIVIQAGAVMAVLGLYRKSVWMMLNGLAGRSPDGLRLLGLLALAFVPAGIAGAIAGHEIKSRLFRPEAVALALGLGGVAMVLIENRRARLMPREPDSTPSARPAEFDPAAIAYRTALLIGLAQCAALWPGVSRSMATILAAILLGVKPRDAAQFSFLLALPTLGAATLHDVYQDGPRIFDAVGTVGLLLGFAFSWAVAAASVKGLLRYLNSHGLAPFGWYRIALAIAVYLVWVG